jgi:D-amino-acid oxidase
VSRTRVVIIGGGVSGLTCAHELAASHDVLVLHDSELMETTSAIATAIWHVYLVDPNDLSVLRWSEATLHRLLVLADGDNSAGVTMVEGVELFRAGSSHEPTWASIPPMFRMLTAKDLERYPGTSWGYEIAAPLIDMDLYLPWLESACLNRGVQFERHHVTSLGEVFDGKDSVVVNCSGLAARELVGDTTLQPVRGQYLIVEKDESAPANYVGDDDHPGGMSFMIPRVNDVCIGGTEEYGVSTMEFVADEDDMLKRAGEFVPWLQKTKPRVIRRVVGLRPYRPEGVRIEAERTDDGIVVHNYGHGGSGVSLSWGCASDVVNLVEAALPS